VVNDTKIRIVVVLMITAGWTAMLLDVRGAFMDGRTRHVEEKHYFLSELKETGLIICEWCSGKEMSSDILTEICS
jgi:hypothetical protein